MKRYVTFLAAFFITLSGVTFGQADGNRQFKDSIDKIMKQKLIDRLGVDEPTADKFLNTYKENNKKIRLLNKEKNELLESIELDPGAIDMDSKLDKMLDLESRMVEQRKSFFVELRGFLTPQQVAGTMILKKNFEKQLRKVITGQRKRERNKEKGKNKQN